jgi:DNA-binding XRE family transcriptional regulator
MTMKTKIYLIRSGDFVKIGKADDPIARWQNIQTGCPTTVELLGWIEADASEERRLHERFAAHRQRGEWFRWCKEIADFAATLGAPLRVREQAKLVFDGSAVLTPGQCRTARAWLRLRTQDVADKANITRQTVTRFETEKTVATAGTATLIRGALEKLGAEFPDLETVRLRAAQS